MVPPVGAAFARWPATVNSPIPIAIDEIRVGMFIQLPLSWLHHPFPTSSFRITSQEQISTLRQLGLSTLSYLPGKSLSAGLDVGAGSTPAPTPNGQEERSGSATDDNSAGEEGVSASEHCLGRYRLAAATYDAVADEVQQQAVAARERAECLVRDCVEELVEKEACAIRLLSDTQSGGEAAHAVNVMVLALLLGRTLQLQGSGLHDLGLAALLHDIGKVTMPAHIGESGAPLSAAELQRYRSHVGESVALGQAMGLPSDVLIAIAQHHEMADGSGYPLQLLGEDLSVAGRILALVNVYDRLCNPLQGAEPLTPHEAVSQLYAQRKGCFDPVVLESFIRMMGVYPPGSLVELVDGRLGLVVSVDAMHPLRPVVLVLEDGSGLQRLDLARAEGTGIRRSLRPAQLPAAALRTLLPHSRIQYYFERATAAAQEQGGPG